MFAELVNLHVGVSPIQEPVMSQVIPSQEESWDKNDQVMEQSASQASDKSDCLISKTSWRKNPDVSNKNSDDTVRDQFPSPV